MRKKMAEQFKKNEAENAVFAKMLEETLAKEENKDMISRKFEGIQTLTRNEAKRIMADF